MNYNRTVESKLTGYNRNLLGRDGRKNRKKAIEVEIGISSNARREAAEVRRKDRFSFADREREVTP